MIELCGRLGINFIYPEYIMIDACDAEYNALVRVFGPQSIILMCWFPVLLNVKKPDRKKPIPPEHWNQVDSYTFTRG